MEINIKYFLQIQNTVLLTILFVMPEENKSVNFYNFKYIQALQNKTTT